MARLLDKNDLDDVARLQRRCWRLQLVASAGSQDFLRCYLQQLINGGQTKLNGLVLKI